MRQRAIISILKVFDGEHLLLGAILAIGALVRLSGLDMGWFLRDQVRDGMAAQGMLSGQAFPLVGPHGAMSTVLLVGPFYYYLVAIPYALNANPVVGVAFLNLLGVFSIYLTYRLGRAMFGAAEGFIAAALYAVFPMAVFSGKTLWNPGFIPFFSSLFLLTLWRFLIGCRPWALALTLFLLGVLVQIHVSGAFFVLLLSVALFMYRPPLQRWPLVTGLIGIVLLFVPYVVFEVQHGFPDADKIFAWAGKNSTASFWQIAGRGFWAPFVLPERLAAALGKGVTPSIFPVVQRAELTLLALGILGLFLLILKAKDRRPPIFLGLWFVLPFVIIPFNKIVVPWYYFDILYPAQFLIIGVLFQRVRRIFHKIGVRERANQGCCIALALLVGLLVALQVWFTISFEGKVQRSGLLKFTGGIFLTSPDLGEATIQTMPLRDKRALAKSFLRDFGVDHASAERRVHGASYQLFREDKGFLFETLAPHLPAKQPDATFHYLIVHEDFQVSVEQRREARVGAYRIVAYQPMIQYESWQWSVNPEAGWWNGISDNSAWNPLTLPAREVPDAKVYADTPYVRWPDKTVAFRGWLIVPSMEQPVWLVLNIRSDYFLHHRLGGFYCNGQPLTAERTISYDSLNSHNVVEVLVDATSALRTGSNLIAFEVTGVDGEFDLDLYELRLAMRPEGY